MLLPIISNIVKPPYLDYLHVGFLKLFINCNKKKFETFVLSNIITGFRSYGKSHQERIGYVAENGALFDLSLIDLFFVVLVICCILYFSTHSLHVVYFFKINKLSFILVIKNWNILNLFFIKHKSHVNDWKVLQKYCMLYKTYLMLFLASKP